MSPTVHIRAEPDAVLVLRLADATQFEPELKAAGYLYDRTGSQVLSVDLEKASHAPRLAAELGRIESHDWTVSSLTGYLDILREIAAGVGPHAAPLKRLLRRHFYGRQSP